MANQGWTTGNSPYTAQNNFTNNWESDKIEALDNTTLSFETTATSEGSSYPAFNSNKNPKGLRFYSTSTNNNTITVKVPDNSYCFAGVTFIGTDKLKVNGTSTASGTKVDLTDKPTEIVFASDVKSTMAVSKVEFVLEKVAAKAAPVRRAAANINATITISNQWSETGTKYTKDAPDVVLKSDAIDGMGQLEFKTTATNSGSSNWPGYFTGNPAGLRLYANNSLTINAPNGYTFVSLLPTTSDPFIYNGVEKASGSTITFNAGTKSFVIEPVEAKKAISVLEFVLAPEGGDPGMETVKTPVITVSTQAQPTDPVTVTIACETAEPTIKYTITNGSTTGDELTYSAPFTISDPGSYTINAYAMKDGMNNSAAATPVSFTIAKPARVPEAVEELFLVMEKNFWNVDGKYPETVVPFVYNAEQGYYDLDISAIPATYGEDAINGGFMGEFYVRDGKANNLGLVFSAEAPVSAANMMAAYAVTPAQNIEQGVEYNMSVKPAEATSFKKFTTSNIAYKNGTLRVTYTPGKKDASAVKTLQILNSETVTGINAAIADSDAPVEYFNLQGVRIAYPQAGQILIRRQGDKVEKIRF